MATRLLARRISLFTSHRMWEPLIRLLICNLWSSLPSSLPRIKLKLIRYVYYFAKLITTRCTKTCRHLLVVVWCVISKGNWLFSWIFELYTFSEQPALLDLVHGTGHWWRLTIKCGSSTHGLNPDSSGSSFTP